MTRLSPYSISQPAVVVADVDEAVDRVHELLGAVPSERLMGANEVDQSGRVQDASAARNAVYAFADTTFLELLGPVEEGHTRWRFLQRFGPGYYMFCADLENESPQEVADELERLGVRVVAGGPGPRRGRVKASFHLHPHDACGMLMLLAIKQDLHDNRDWAGESYRAYIDGNTRIAHALKGVAARTSDPAGDAPQFGKLGFEMVPLGSGGWGWRGEGGTVLELWPEDAWDGESVDDQRDYALCLTAREPDTLVQRLERSGLKGQDGPRERWLSSVDPIIGVRWAVEASDGGV